MMIWLTKLARSSPIDSKATSIVDWIILGRYTGYRRCEWCQTTQKDYARIEEWPGQPSEAAIIEDFEFLSLNKKSINPTTASDPDAIEFVRIRWRKQKKTDKMGKS